MAGPRGGLEENPGLDRTQENEARRSDKAGFRERAVQNISRGLSTSEIHHDSVAANCAKRETVKRLLQIMIWPAAAGLASGALGTMAFAPGATMAEAWMAYAAPRSYRRASRL